MTAVALVAGCRGTSPPPSASPSSLPKTTLTACTVDGLAARCGNVWVPQDWAHPAGPAMPLRVVVLPATATSHPAAPLFYLAGYNGDDAGFGDAVLNGMTWAVQAFAQLNQTMDLVFVEQRGTSGSGLETCPGLQQTSATLDLAAISAAARRCLASASRDPRHDTTTSAVRDLDQVRQALGYDKINIYGPSYGVTIGLAYLQRYGSHVRTAVLDSGSLLNVPLWQQGAVHDQQVFDQLAARCAITPIECSDGWAAMNPATVSQQGPSVFTPIAIAQAERLHALCAVWPHDPGASGTVRTTVPVVFLNGTADTTDPPANVAGATATMPNALLVSVPGTGHWTLDNATDPGCLLAATTAFIQAGQPASPAAWDACTRALAQELVPFPTS